MSRIIAYRRFISVRFENDAGDPVDAFEARPVRGATAVHLPDDPEATLEARPLPGTAETLSRHGLLARAQADGVALYYRTNPEASPALRGPITARIRLSFTLHLREHDFFERHQPDLSASTGAAIQIDNLDGAGAIVPDGSALSVAARVSASDAIDIVPRVFPVSLDVVASSPASVEAREVISGVVASSQDVFATPGAAAASVQLDVTGSNDVVFRVAEVPPGPVDRRAYTDDGAGASGAIGMLDLHWETAQTSVPEPDGVVYHVVFERR